MVQRRVHQKIRENFAYTETPGFYFEILFLALVTNRLPVNDPVSKPFPKTVFGGIFESFDTLTCGIYKSYHIDNKWRQEPKHKLKWLGTIVVCSRISKSLLWEIQRKQYKNKNGLNSNYCFKTIAKLLQ